MTKPLNQALSARYTTTARVRVNDSTLKNKSKESGKSKLFNPYIASTRDFFLGTNSLHDFVGH